ncbi:carbohydrate ABC transporter permease [Paenibacillus nasutitermitis]|uniref:ABC transporter permease protein YtcP n=1 Tax=Paenibacillus nasutitermitis TaxID=1652958 RepID=A0A917E0F0_9BACL|nr:carbohydrate ABC transporter permease [Paenibacillus nasutitermitis]GGD85085.1 putative ABC transporter permease protein YtcP [Paenibacillus nasutitermitis]
MLLTTSEKWFNKLIIVFMLIIGVAMLLPFVNVIAKSFSSNAMVMAGEVGFFPREFNVHAYREVFRNPLFLTSMQVTVFVTVAGTFCTLFTVVTTGYALSRKRLLARRAVMLYFLITMFFHAGIIPNFLNIRNLGLYDTIWALILPGMMSVYYMILVKSFFEQLPSELEESASIDGSNDIQTLAYVYLPISKPILATIGLFAAVHYWNTFTPGVMFIQTPTLYPLQVLVQMIISTQTSMDMQNMAELDLQGTLGTETLKMAVIVVSTLPIVIVYPFLQKHFVKGITLGAVKA